MATIWTFPTRIVFGEGVAETVGGEAKRLGASRALVVSDGAVGDAGATDVVCTSLQSAGLEVERFDGITPNPKETEIRAATALFTSTQSDLVVAVGGGSVIDAGKLVAILARGPLDLTEDAPLETTTDDAVPMVAVGTTAGTGSEVSAVAAITTEGGRKRTLSHVSLMPEVAVLDPALTVTMPPSLTAATGFEALSRCIEAFCAAGDHPMADAIALDGIRLAIKCLPKAVSDPEDLPARGGMMKAAVMGGVAKQKGRGVGHALADALCAHFELHHGLASALCLPAVLDFNRSVVPNRIARIAQLLNVRGDDEETLAFECSGALRALRKKVGLPDSLGELALPEALLPDLAKTAFQSPAHAVNPRPCSEDDILAMLRATF